MELRRADQANPPPYACEMPANFACGTRRLVLEQKGNNNRRPYDVTPRSHVHPPIVHACGAATWAGKPTLLLGEDARSWGELLAEGLPPAGSDRGGPVSILSANEAKFRERSQRVKIQQKQSCKMNGAPIGGKTCGTRLYRRTARWTKTGLTRARGS
jgi:hypothetical protein